MMTDLDTDDLKLATGGCKPATAGKPSLEQTLLFIVFEQPDGLKADVLAKDMPAFIADPKGFLKKLKHIT
jgi:hypothetical protein